MNRAVFAALAWLACCYVSVAAAAPEAPAGQGTRSLPVETGTQTLAPLAFVAFCTRNPGDCVPSSHPFPSLTAARKAELDDVNRRVNAMILPRDYDEETDWKIAPKQGNCNDYAVTKRHLLLRMGWPPSSLLLARVRTIAPMVDHLILVVRTNEESFVLDNLQSEVRPKQEKAYHWLKRQSTADPRLWVWGS